MTPCRLCSREVEGLTRSLAALKVSLLVSWLVPFLWMSPACPIPARQPFANFPLMLVAPPLPAPPASGEGLVFWEGVETTAQGDLEKLIQSSGSPINHVYADMISGAIAVLCWSPAAGVSGGRGWQMPSAAKPCCG